MNAYGTINITKYLKSTEVFFQPFNNVYSSVSDCLFFSSASNR